MCWELRLKSSLIWMELISRVLVFFFFMIKKKSCLSNYQFKEDEKCLRKTWTQSQILSSIQIYQALVSQQTHEQEINTNCYLTRVFFYIKIL